MNSKSLKSVIVFLLLTLQIYCQEAQPQVGAVKALNAYNTWRSSYKKAYQNEDEKQFRQIIFLDNYAKVQQHNSNPQSTYKMGINQFSDMTQEEFVQRVLTLKLENNSNVNSKNTQNISVTSNTSNSSSPFTQSSSPTVQSSFIPHNPDAHYAAGGIPTYVDWRTKGFNTPVRNQGYCGSCWAHSAVGAMEGIKYKWGKTLKAYSEQQIVDCAIRSKGYQNDGCQGGVHVYAAYYATKYGMKQLHEYPYTDSQGACTINSPLSPASNYFFPTTMWYVEYGSDYLKEAIAFSPTSIAVDASLWGSYSSGVFNGCSSQVTINHGVIGVGYDIDGNWIIKNSWGASWGEQGYIKLAPGNSCGIFTSSWVFTSYYQQPI